MGEKFKSYCSTKTEFLKDGGYIDHEVTYVWDNGINQYVEKN